MASLCRWREKSVWNNPLISIYFFSFLISHLFSPLLISSLLSLSSRSPPVVNKMSIIYTSFIFVFSFFNFPLICIYFFILYSPILLFISTTRHLIHNPPPCARLGLNSSTVHSHHDIATETDGWSNDGRSPSSSKSEELEYAQLARVATCSSSEELDHVPMPEELDHARLAGAAQRRPPRRARTAAPLVPVVDQRFLSCKIRHRGLWCTDGVFG